MLGGLVIGLVTELSTLVIDPAYKNLAAFVVLVIVLLLRPVGILADVRVTAGVGGMSSAVVFYLTTLLVYFGVDLLAVWGLNLQYGVAGVANLAFVLFQAAGAYTAAVLTLGPSSGNGGFQSYIGGAALPFPLPILAGGAVAGLLSLLVGAVGLRRLRADYLALVMLVVAVIGNELAQSATGLVNGPAGLAAHSPTACRCRTAVIDGLSVVLRRPCRGGLPGGIHHRSQITKSRSVARSAPSGRMSTSPLPSERTWLSRG